MATLTKRAAKKKRTPAKKKPATNGQNAAPVAGERKDVPIGRVARSPFQQRAELPKEKVRELAESIRSVGLLQPLVVRAKPGYRTALAKADWELIAGECRWRACQSLGHKEIRVEVWDVDDRACRAMVAAENLQRNDLNAIEEARTYQQAIDAGDAPGPTELAKQYGVSQGHVSNRIRLLGLPEKVQAAIISREIPPTHARSLIAFKDHAKLLDAILEGLRGEQRDRKEEGPISVDAFEDVVDQVVFDATAAIGLMPYSTKLRGNVPKPKLTAGQREALGIITVGGTFGRKPVERATNRELWNKIVDEQERKAIDRAEKKGPAAKNATNGKQPNVKVSPAAQKRLDEAERQKAKVQAEKSRRALWRWYVDWLRWLVARELRQTTGQYELLLVLLLRGGKWYHHQVDAEQCLVDAGRACKWPIGNNAAKDLVGIVGHDKLFGVAREFAARLFHAPDRPSPLVPDADVGEIARYLAIDIEAAWLREQAGPVYSEAYWRLHSIEQLARLAVELKVKIPKGAKKSDYVETFLSRIPATDTGKPPGLALPKEISKIRRPR